MSRPKRGVKRARDSRQRKPSCSTSGSASGFWYGPPRCSYAPIGSSYAPIGNNWKPRHARPGPVRTISPSGSRTEGRNIPSTSAWLREEAYPRGGRTEIERPDDRRTEAWRRASGIAPCWAGAARSPKGRSVSWPGRRRGIVALVSAEALEQFDNGKPDPRTLELLRFE
jgi:hypothetical protein